MTFDEAKELLILHSFEGDDENDHLQDDDSLDKRVMGSLWDICLVARLWGVQPDGMLRSSNIISNEESERLQTWIDTISWTVSFLMAGNDWHTAIREGNVRDLDLSRLE